MKDEEIISHYVVGYRETPSISWVAVISALVGAAIMYSWIRWVVWWF